MAFETGIWREFLLEATDRERPKKGRQKINIMRALFIKETFREEKTGEYSVRTVSIITLYDGGSVVATVETDFENTMYEKAAHVLASAGRKGKYGIAQMPDGSYVLARLGPETIVSV